MHMYISGGCLQVLSGGMLHGNQLIETWLAQNGRPPNSMNPVEKLCVIGTRGMGALEFEPAQLKAGKNTFSVDHECMNATIRFWQCPTLP